MSIQTERSLTSLRPDIVEAGQQTSESPSMPIYPLQSGDHLTRAEFERRYTAMPHIKNAELIEGVVYVNSPVSASHGRPHSMMITVLGNYAAPTPLIEIYDNTTVRLDLDNEPQPDCCLRLPRDKGGQSQTSKDGYIEGPPELIAEIAASSASYELHSKKNAYRRNGVREYLVWRTLDKAIDWFVLHEGEYHLLGAGEDGILRSLVFPGLWLDTAALLAGDMAKVLSVIQQGIASPEHQAFVESLEAK